MSSNMDTDAALRFHAATKYRVLPHEAGEGDDDAWYVMGTPPEVEPPIWEEDWSIMPRPYKAYSELAPLPLPSEVQHTDIPALEALADKVGAPGSVDTPAIAQLARLSNGLLHRSRTFRRRGLVEFRTAGGTGARYHLELYFVCGELPNLAAGVYHYATQDHALRQLRAGDFRGHLVSACGGEPSLIHAPAAVIMTSTFWRNAWRYRARAYRHTYWDAGTSLTNLLAVAASLGIPARVVMGYADDLVNALIGVDGEREAAVAVCSLGSGSQAPLSSGPLATIAHATEPVSASEVTFPEIPRLHHASELDSSAAAANWRRAPLRRQTQPPQGHVLPLEPLAADRRPSAPIEHVILGRRSRRRYALDEPVDFELFSTVLESSARGFPCDALADDALPLHDNYLIVNAVEGLEPGLYLHRPLERAVELLRTGEFRATAAHLAFDQPYAGDAHVNSYYLTELGAVLGSYGNRGYRLAQVEAALHAGRLHLAAEALGLGAVALTSFDDEVIDVFSPRAAEASYMFITVFGRRRRPTV
jgi:SagB-type dehydrogenase family enzyme